jgi:hypothetical protein
VGDVCRWMNEPLNDPHLAYEHWTGRLGFTAHPPAAHSLPFAALFSKPLVQGLVANSAS